MLVFNIFILSVCLNDTDILLFISDLDIEYKFYKFKN